MVRKKEIVQKHITKHKMQNVTNNYDWAKYNAFIDITFLREKERRENFLKEKNISLLTRYKEFLHNLLSSDHKFLQCQFLCSVLSSKDGRLQ